MDPRLRLLAFGPLALLALVARSDGNRPRLGFHPEPGRTFVRSFREETSFRAESLVQRIGETELPGPTPDLEGSSSRELVAADTFGELEGGRPTALERHFETVAGEIRIDAELEGAEEEHREDLECALEDARVAFAWDADEERYEARLVDGEDGAEELVGGLREDLDLRALLPSDSVAEGDRWSVEGDALRALFAPGGALALRFGYEPDGPFELLAIEDLAAAATSARLCENAAAPDGELALEWKGMRQVDGRSVAVIALELEATLEEDASPAFERLLDASGIETEREELALRTSFTITGKGELTWDLELGVFHELELAFDWRARVVESWRQRFGTHELDYETELELAGTSKLEAECEPR